MLIGLARLERETFGCIKPGSYNTTTESSALDKENPTKSRRREKMDTIEHGITATKKDEKVREGEDDDIEKGIKGCATGTVPTTFCLPTCLFGTILS